MPLRASPEFSICCFFFFWFFVAVAGKEAMERGYQQKRIKKSLRVACQGEREPDEVGHHPLVVGAVPATAAPHNLMSSFYFCFCNF